MLASCIEEKEMNRTACLRNTLLIIAAAVATACAPDRSQLQAPQDARSFPEAHYRQLQASGEQVLPVDPSQSLLVLEVRRAGAFARFGHDHVVASHDVKGYVAPAEGRADLMIRLDELVIDEAALRKQAGFDTQPTADDIAGTRHNMLSKVLDAERYPYAFVHIVRNGDADILRVAITLHGQTRTYAVPAKIERNANRISVGGVMHFNQSDFGITPYSILNGALSVQDRLDLRFDIVAAQ
jgi:polyisoprenoid-binding protein YceI